MNPWDITGAVLVWGSALVLALLLAVIFAAAVVGIIKGVSKWFTPKSKG